MAILKGLALITVALRAYISFNKEKGERRRDEWLELREEYRNARNSSFPNFSRDRVAIARQKLQDHDDLVARELNQEMDKAGLL